MKYSGKHIGIFAMCVGALLLFGAGQPASAYEVTLSLYNQGFDIEKFYNNGDFNVEAGIVNAAPTSLLVIVGDPANVEDVLDVPNTPNPFLLAAAGSSFHFEAAQPFRFQDRFDGLFSTTVDDPLLLVPDASTLTAFQDGGGLADDRLDLLASTNLPPVYYEMDSRDLAIVTTLDGTVLYISRVWRNADYTVTFDIVKAPEPGTLVLLGVGLIGIIGITRRKRKMMTLKKNFPFSILSVSIVLLTVFTALTLSPVYLWADEIQDKIMQKWQEMRNRGLDIGDPTREVVDAWGSPYGTTGKVRFFGNGDIYYHTSGPRVGQVFELHGRIWGTYNREGGTGSFLGFLISDEKSNGPFGHPVSYFEGGCITSENGIDYDLVIKGCKEGTTPEKPKLDSATCRNSCIELENAKHELKANEFNLTFKPYTPRSYNVDFTPKIVEFPWSDRTMVRDVKVTVNTGEYGSKDTNVTIVNPDISWDYAPYGIQFDFLKTVKKIEQSLKPINDKINELSKFGGFCKSDLKFEPLISIGAEGSKICCSDPTGIKDAFKLYLDFSADFGGLSCEIPIFPLPFGFRANLIAGAGLSAALNLNTKTSCEPRNDLCGEVGLSPYAELGGSITDPTGGKMLDGSLKGQFNFEVGGEGCYNLSTKAWKFKGEACITPKIVVEVKVATFLKRSATIKIGGKRCKDWE